jgi:ADP-ribose pyrophosphatase YjhB (NUDIX family)
MADYIDKLAFIYLKDDRLLVTLSKGKDVWYIPGGKREGDETDEQALNREVLEELNVELRPETIEKYGVFEAQAHGKAEGMIVRMTCYTAEFDGQLLASSEIEKFDFFEYERMHETSDVDHLIMNDLHTKGLLA